MNEMRVLILGGAAPYYPPRLTAFWHSLGCSPRECPASAGRVNATCERALCSTIRIRKEVRTERHSKAIA